MSLCARRQNRLQAQDYGRKIKKHGQIQTDRAFLFIVCE